jgi:GNAT superfamily N-acetyltransferase
VVQWVQAAATQQQRDPARLEPLKPLSEVLVIRMPEKPDFADDEYAPGLLGLGQKMNPGDWSKDMEKVKQLARDIGGYSEQQIFQMNFLSQGFRSYMVCEDARTGDIVGCAQLTRIQVGGYLYLTDDYQIQHVFVKEEYRRLGIANHMIHELLTRLKPTQRAWAWADRDSEPFYALFASGFVGITYKECGRVFPAALWAALWPFHRVGLSKPNNVFFATEGRGTMAAYNPAG